MVSTTKTKTTWRIISVVIIFLIWQIAAQIIKSNIIVPSPIDVIVRICSLITTKKILIAIIFSVLRIIIAFVLSFLLGSLLAYIAYKNQIIKILLEPFMWCAKTIPVAAVVIVLLLFFRPNGLAIFISLIVTLPIFYHNILTGLENLPANLKDLNTIYKIKFTKRLRMIIIPNVYSYLSSACALTTSIAWKSAVAAEIIGIPNNSIGKLMYYSKISLDTTSLIGYVVIIVVLSTIFSKVTTKIFDKVFLCK